MKDDVSRLQFHAQEFADELTATVQAVSLQCLPFVATSRFRPSLEDVLEMLIDEFDVDHDGQAREKLAQGRKRWRVVQTRAAVRDAPATAAETLRDLGYRIELPDGVTAPANRRDRLTSP